MTNRVRITIEYQNIKKAIECDLLLGVFMTEHTEGYDSEQSIVGTSDTFGLLSAIRHLRRLEAMLRAAIPEPILEAIISSLPETKIAGARPDNTADKHSVEDEALIVSHLINLLGGLNPGK